MSRKDSIQRMLRNGASDSDSEEEILEPGASERGVGERKEKGEKNEGGEGEWTGLYIIVDDREHKVKPFIEAVSPDFNIPYRVERLNVGDYAIMYNGHILAIIERKTWKDMAASIKDGRSRNVEKLKAAEQESKCTLFYLIEGSAFPNPTQKVQRVPYKNLIAHMDHLQIRDNIHIIQTKNKDATARRLFTLASNIGTLKIEYFKDMKAGGGEKTLKKKKVPKDEEIELNVWSSLPNITYKTAKLFMDEGYTIKQLITGELGRETIAMLEYPSGGKIGQRAQRILKITNEEKSKNSYEKLLAAIPLVSRDTAKVILKEYSIMELFELEDPVEKLKNIQKSEKRKLGNTAANNINKFLLK